MKSFVGISRAPAHLGTGPNPLRLIPPDEVQLYAGLMFDAPGFGEFSVPGTLRPGIAPILVGITSSQPNAVRTDVSSFTISREESYLSFKVRSVSVGEASIRLSSPERYVPPSGQDEYLVKVNKASFYAFSEVTVGRDLVIPLTIRPTYSMSQSSAVLTVTSSDPNKFLLSTKYNEPGQSSVLVPFRSFQDTDVFYVQGISEGKAELKVSGSSYNDSLLPVNVEKPNLYLSTPQIAFLNQPTQVTVGVGYLPGAGPTSTVRYGAEIKVDLKSTNPEIATVESPVNLRQGDSKNSTKMTPSALGQTKIQLDAPAGFGGGPQEGNVVVTLAPLPMAGLVASYSVGNNLQAEARLSLGSGFSSFDFTISSSDPERLLISSDPKTVGSGSVAFNASTFKGLIYL